MIPRGITYRLVPGQGRRGRLSHSRIGRPGADSATLPESRGPDQNGRRLIPSAIFMGPSEMITVDKEEDVDMLVKDGPRFTRVVTMAHHPFDVVGWDGYRLSIHLQRRRISSRSQARSISRRRFIRPSRSAATSSAPSRRACSILIPRRSRFRGCTTTSKPTKFCFTCAEISVRAEASRAGSITLHPRGIPHGPHPGTIMASKDALRTEELAVMFDTAAHPRADRAGAGARR